MKRREFLAGCSATVLATSANLSLASSADAKRSNGLASRENFHRLLNESLRVYDRNMRFVDELQLIDIVDGKSSKAIEQFTLILEGSTKNGFSEGTYEVCARGSVASFPLFLQTDDVSSRRYRATFSLLNAALN